MGTPESSHEHLTNRWAVAWLTSSKPQVTIVTGLLVRESGHQAGSRYSNSPLNKCRNTLRKRSQTPPKVTQLQHELANRVFGPWPIFPWVAGLDVEPGLEKCLFKVQVLFQAVGHHLWADTLSLSGFYKGLHLQRAAFHAG